MVDKKDSSDIVTEVLYKVNEMLKDENNPIKAMVYITCGFKLEEDDKSKKGWMKNGRIIR